MVNLSSLWLLDREYFLLKVIHKGIMGYYDDILFWPPLSPPQYVIVKVACLWRKAVCDDNYVWEVSIESILIKERLWVLLFLNNLKNKRKVNTNLSILFGPKDSLAKWNIKNCQGSLLNNWPITANFPSLSS